MLPAVMLMYSGVARIVVEEGRVRIFVVLYRLFFWGGGSRCPFSMKRKIE